MYRSALGGVNAIKRNDPVQHLVRLPVVVGLVSATVQSHHARIHGRRWVFVYVNLQTAADCIVGRVVAAAVIRGTQQGVVVNGVLADGERHAFQAARLPDDVVAAAARPLMDGSAALQVGETEGLYPVSTIYSANQVVERTVLGNGE